MKNLLSILLVLALCLGLASTAMAAYPGAKEEFDEHYELDGYVKLMRESFHLLKPASGGETGYSVTEKRSLYNIAGADSVFTATNTNTDDDSVLTVCYYAYRNCEDYDGGATGWDSLSVERYIMHTDGNETHWCSDKVTHAGCKELEMAYGDSVSFSLPLSQGEGGSKYIYKLMVKQYYPAMEKSWMFTAWILVEDETATGFKDVKPGDYFYEPVIWAVENGVTDGMSDTEFSPGILCTNAHILTFLWRANGSPETVGRNSLRDVKASDWYYQSAQWARSTGLISGSTMSPTEPCTRASTVMYLWQAAGSPRVNTRTSFTDVPADADYAMAVAWAVENGITDGMSENEFSHDTTCTRGQIVTFLHRAYAQ